MKRGELLDAAKHYVTEDRQTDHGKPEGTFAAIALLWESYLAVEITPVDVANLMVLLKIARAQQNPHHIDNYADIAGYAACASELVTETAP